MLGLLHHALEATGVVTDRVEASDHFVVGLVVHAVLARHDPAPLLVFLAEQGVAIFRVDIQGQLADRDRPEQLDLPMCVAGVGHDRVNELVMGDRRIERCLVAVKVVLDLAVRLQLPQRLVADVALLAEPGNLGNHIPLAHVARKIVDLRELHWLLSAWVGILRRAGAGRQQAN